MDFPFGAGFLARSAIQFAKRSVRNFRYADSACSVKAIANRLKVFQCNDPDTPSG